MIYPPSFPVVDGQDYKTNPEKIVYDLLKPLSSKYDIFYSQKFRAESVDERTDYEIDFVMIKPQEAILIVEVKGGLIEYNGSEKTWYQNHNKMKKPPTDQVISCVSSLLKRYPDVAKKLPVNWTVCFPQCELLNENSLPTNVNREVIIDQRDLLTIDKKIESLFKSTKQEFYFKKGQSRFEYNRFKQQLLRGLGFVKRLSTTIELDEKAYIRLSREQYNVFRQATDNKRLVVNGPAGSGKTILAKELAKELLAEGKRVLFLCYNRTLSSVIRQEFRNEWGRDASIEVSTFHHFARQQINDDIWFQDNKKEPYFWELLIPSRLESVPTEELDKYDAIIVDEGQDFKLFWYGLLEKHLEENSRFLVFLDKNQDIFNHFTQLPEEQKLSHFKLTRNCRNSKEIIRFIADQTGLSSDCFEESPVGDCIVRNYKNDTEQVKLLRDDIIHLIENEGLLPSQIVILIHSHKAESCLADVKKIKNYSLISAYRPQDRRENNILYATVEIFKGLESDVVMLVDNDQIVEDEHAKRLYVEASRAKHRLYVYQNKI
jgi:superfamily I DNA/RNA helicase